MNFIGLYASSSAHAFTPRALTIHPPDDRRHPPPPAANVAPQSLLRNGGAATAAATGCRCGSRAPYRHHRAVVSIVMDKNVDNNG